ncbi:hypothetical protein J1N35_008837 [Gossypium stocksii]|uniref:Uncharacterized protein n=1 Tax=Gossypium stocksii TaxID=47602 RepID=A0A9D3W8X7_9ROSI|nr:hypothetical protein J1N35_008837 [Gossypium stocksii]
MRTGWFDCRKWYVTSLAQFAADLGPFVWKIASRKIDSVLPRKVKFGPGWVEENRSIEQPQCLFSGKQRSSNSTSGNHSSIQLQLLLVQALLLQVDLLCYVTKTSNHWRTKLSKGFDLCTFSSVSAKTFTALSSAMCAMHASNFVSEETKAVDNSVGLHSRNAMVSHPDLALQL